MAHLVPPSEPSIPMAVVRQSSDDVLPRRGSMSSVQRVSLPERFGLERSSPDSSRGETLLAQAIVPSMNDTGTTVSSPTGSPNQFDIGGGRLAGGNLFHGFQQFGLGQGQVANFLATPSVSNILARVLGGASYIDGLVQVTGGTPNLFLVNPAGMVFGPNARLDVPGAFTATTANGVRMGDRWFDAIGSNNYADLEEAPNALAFSGSQPGAIANFGDLAVKDGQSLALVGGTVLNTGLLSAPGGRVTVMAVPGMGLVSMESQGDLLNFVADSASSGDLPSVGGLMSPLSLPELLTGGQYAGATGVKVHEDGRVELTGSATPVATEAGSVTVSGKVDVSSNSYAGDIDISGTTVNLIEEAQVKASGEAGAGSISVIATDSVLVGKDAVIAADTPSSGKSGNVIIGSSLSTKILGNIRVQGGYEYYAPNERGAINIFSLGETKIAGSLDASGNKPYQIGGDVTIFGNQISLTEQAEINVSGNDIYAYVTGLVRGVGRVKVGEISIDIDGESTQTLKASQVFVEKGAAINASSINYGHGGEVKIISNDLTEFNGDVSARGNGLERRGGFVDIGSEGKLFFDGQWDLRPIYSYGYDRNGTLSLKAASIRISDDLLQPSSDISQFSSTQVVAAMATANLNLIAKTNIIVDSEINTRGNPTIFELKLNAPQIDLNASVFSTGDSLKLLGSTRFAKDKTVGLDSDSTWPRPYVSELIMAGGSALPEKINFGLLKIDGGDVRLGDLKDGRVEKFEILNANTIQIGDLEAQDIKMSSNGGIQAGNLTAYQAIDLSSVDDLNIGNIKTRNSVSLTSLNGNISTGTIEVNSNELSGARIEVSKPAIFVKAHGYFMIKEALSISDFVRSSFSSLPANIQKMIVASAKEKGISSDSLMNSTATFEVGNSETPVSIGFSRLAYSSRFNPLPESYFQSLPPSRFLEIQYGGGSVAATAVNGKIELSSQVTSPQFSIGPEINRVILPDNLIQNTLQDSSQTIKVSAIFSEVAGLNGFPNNSSGLTGGIYLKDTKLIPLDDNPLGTPNTVDAKFIIGASSFGNPPLLPLPEGVSSDVNLPVISPPQSPTIPIAPSVGSSPVNPTPSQAKNSPPSSSSQPSTTQSSLTSTQSLPKDIQQTSQPSQAIIFPLCSPSSTIPVNPENLSQSANPSPESTSTSPTDPCYLPSSDSSLLKIDPNIYQQQHTDSNLQLKQSQIIQPTPSPQPTPVDPDSTNQTD